MQKTCREGLHGFVRAAEEARRQRLRVVDRGEVATRSVEGLTRLG